jgi:hypothetical protein
MKKPKITEKEYVEKIIGMMHTGAVRRVFHRLFSFGTLAGLSWLVIAGGAFFGYLRMGGTQDDWHFIFGFVIGSLLCPAIFTLGVGLARCLGDISVNETKPLLLMVKYHNQLVKEGHNPYEEMKP